MTKRRNGILLAAPLAAGILAGCLSQPEPNPDEKSLSTAAATAAIGPVQTYAKVTWTLRTPAGLKASKIAFGANQQMWMVATGTGVNGVPRTNGLFYWKNAGTDWASLAAAQSSAVKTTLSSEPSSNAGASIFYTTTDNKIFQVNSTETALSYGTGFRAVSASNFPGGGFYTDVWAIKAGTDDVYYRNQAGNQFVAFGLKAKALARGANGTLWIIDQTDRPCSRTPTTPLVCYSTVAGSKIATGTNGQVKAWMLGRETVSIDGEYAVYWYDGSKWIRADASGKEIAVDNNGNPWIIKGTGQVYSGTVTTFSDQTGTLAIDMIAGSANEIAVGGLENATWIRGIDSKPLGSNTFSIMKSGAWSPTSGYGLSIDVDGGGQAWIIGSNNSVYRSFDGVGWFEVSTQPMSEIGVGKGNVWAIGTDPFTGNIYNKTIYFLSNNGWKKITKLGGQRIDVAPDNHAWVLDGNGDIYESTDEVGDNWKWHFGPRANDIGVGMDGTVWITGNVNIPGSQDFPLYRWDKATDKWTLMPGGGQRISVSKTGKPWLTNYAKEIWRTL